MFRIAAFMLFLSLYKQAIVERPVIFFPGYRSTCEDVRYGFGGQTGFECYQADTWIITFLSLKRQATRICKDFRTAKLNLGEKRYKEGVILVGISQGGLVAKEFMRICKDHVKTKGLITIGTPNLGMDEIPPIIRVGEGTTNRIARFLFRYAIRGQFVFPSAPFEYINRSMITKANKKYQTAQEDCLELSQTDYSSEQPSFAYSGAVKAKAESKSGNYDKKTELGDFSNIGNFGRKQESLQIKEDLVYDAGIVDGVIMKKMTQTAEIINNIKDTEDANNDKIYEVAMNPLKNLIMFGNKDDSDMKKNQAGVSHKNSALGGMAAEFVTRINRRKFLRYNDKSSSIQRDSSPKVNQADNGTILIDSINEPIDLTLNLGVQEDQTAVDLNDIMLEEPITKNLSTNFDQNHVQERPRPERRRKRANKIVFEDTDAHSIKIVQPEPMRPLYRRRRFRNRQNQYNLIESKDISHISPNIDKMNQNNTEGLGLSRETGSIHDQQLTSKIGKATDQNSKYKFDETTNNQGANDDIINVNEIDVIDIDGDNQQVSAIDKLENVFDQQDQFVVSINKERFHNTYNNFCNLTKEPKGMHLKMPGKAIMKFLSSPIKDEYSLADLDFNINIAFNYDEYIRPTASQTFGARYDNSIKKPENFEGTQAYRENFLGLGDLHNKSGIFNCALAAGHLEFSITIKNFLTSILVFQDCLGPRKKKYPGPKVVRKCIIAKMIRYDFENFMHCNFKEIEGFREMVHENDTLKIVN